MDTRFSKIVSDPDGRDYLLIEGRVISLAIHDLAENNRFVEVIVSGLRNQSESVHPHFAALKAKPTQPSSVRSVGEVE